MRADREAAQAERSAMVERLCSAMPITLRERAQWLLWKSERHEGEAKPRKVPYYASGKRRTGTQGDEADRAALVAFDIAIERLRRGVNFSGIGFAFLPGDGLIGIDIDGAIDSDGVVSDLCSKVIELAGSYTEFSPSRKGVHIICAGETKTAKDNGIGLEMFCASQYFTCTGEWWPGAPREVRPIDADALGWLHETIALAKAEGKRAKAAASNTKVVARPSDIPPTEPLPARPSVAQGARQGGDDFKRVNDGALRALAAWVPELLPMAHAHASTGGYRVTSKELGRDLQEDLSITPDGIMDFGLERGFTPIDLVMEWSASLKTPKDALHWLAERINLPIALRPRKLRLVSGHAPEDDPPPIGMDERPEPPEEGATASPAGRRRKKSPPPHDGGGGVSARLLEHFALLYGTDQVWDGEQRTTMVVKNLRLLFGTPLVNAWLAHPSRRLLYADQMVFEPGKELPEGHVNLFDGLPTEPLECTETDVKPMLELAQHLCSLSAPTAEGVAAVLDQLMCWLALPLQRPGAKMRFSIVFHGPQGTGKNLFFDAYRSIYGKYGRMVGQSELEDKFNGYLSAKLFIVANEVFTRQELFHGKNKLKAVITDEMIAIRGMHQEVRWESNHCNLAFLSNELMPIALESDDRRHLVVYTPAAEDRDLYLRVADFLANGGAAKFMHYLLRYDTEGFNEHTRPLMTRAKATLIELGLKPAERFANEWLDGYLQLPVQVCSAEQLYRVFRRWCDLNGERFPPPQSMFTESVKRHVFERVERDPVTLERLPPRLTYKVIQLKHDTGPRKSMRCWLPTGTGPANGVTEGEWAASSVDSFESHAARFGRTAAEAET